MPQTGIRLIASLAVFTSLVSLPFCAVNAQTESVVEQKAEQQSGWSLFSPKGEEFSVRLPETPSVTPGAKGSLSYFERSYAGYKDGIVYVIYSAKKGKDAKLGYFVEQFRSQLPKWTSGNDVRSSELKLEGPVKLNGFKGERHRVKLNDRVDGVVIFFLGSNRAYIVQAMGGDERVSAVSQFYNSFSLRRKGEPFQEMDTTKSVLPSAALPPDDKVFDGKEVTNKAVAVVRLSPRYTSEARSLGIKGKVVLKAVLLSAGRVAGIQVIEGLGAGLNENAIEAAELMRFIPASKDGRFVSQRMQLEFYFDY